MRSRTLVLCLFLFVFAQLALAADKSFDIPADMRALMPADAEVCVVLRSLDEADRRVAEIVPNPEENMISDLLPLAMGGDGGLMPYIDRSRPVALLANLPLPSDSAGYTLKLILPQADPALQTAAQEEAVTAVHGDYVSLTVGGPWPASPGGPPWLDTLPDLLMGMRFDMVAIIGKYRPFIEMGLGSLDMAAARAAADTTGTVPAMSADEAEAMAALGHAVINSLDFLDIGFAADGGRLAATTHWGMLPGSPLAPGPQPDFKEARKAAGLLPADWDFISVTALSQTAQMDLWFDYYRATLLKQSAALDPEAAGRLEAWYDKYLAAMEIYFSPTASSVRMEGEVMAYDTVMKVDDPSAALERFAYLLNHAVDAGMGMTATEGDAFELEGVQVRSWDLNFDYEAMMEGMYPPQAIPSAPRPQLQQMSLIMSRLMPGVKMAVAGDYLLFTSGQDEDLFKDMIKRAKKGKTRKQTDLDLAVTRVAGSPEQVVTGDLGTFLTWIVDLMASLDEDEDVDFTWPVGEDLPFTQYLNVDGDVYGLGFEMDSADIKTLLVSIEEMEDD